jgi:hypothetical protein
MPRRRKRKKPKRIVGPKLDPTVWQVRTDFTKGFLTGNRGVVVEVTHLPSNRKLKQSVVAGTKHDARLKAVELIKELVARLESA